MVLIKTQVPEKVPSVTRFDNAIVSLNNGFVHFIDRGKRPIAVLNDVCMAEVNVGREKSIRHVSCNVNYAKRNRWGSKGSLKDRRRRRPLREGRLGT